MGGFTARPQTEYPPSLINKLTPRAAYSLEIRPEFRIQRDKDQRMEKNLQARGSYYRRYNVTPCVLYIGARAQRRAF